MKLDRNLNADGRGKYGLILNRRIKQIEETYGTADGSAGAAVLAALATLVSFGVIDWGATPETEFFVMRLKDEHAGAGLAAYASDVRASGQNAQYADEIYYGLAVRAGRNHPLCKKPD